MLINISSVCFGNNVCTGDIGINYLAVDIFKQDTGNKSYIWNGVKYQSCDTYLYKSMSGD